MFRQLKSSQHRYILFTSIAVPILILSFTCFKVGAQVVGNYSFSRTTVAYASITGTTLCSTITDNAIYTAIPIGFTFSYNCVDYTTVGISTNGFIWFGPNNPTTTNYAPLSSGTMDGVISVYGSNIQSQGSGSYLRYTTTGTAPNRIFKVEWNRAKTSGGSRMDLQIKLYESTNAIQTMVNDAAYFIFTTVYGQVGIRGSTTTDYLNRSVTLASGQSWATSVAGATNTATCVIDGAVIGIIPAAGTVYNWTPTGSCCTTPATQASSAAAGSISYTTADLSWTTGSGTGGDIVFLKQGSAITTDPSNNTTYIANAAFGSGTQIGTTGAYAVYSGSAGAVSITKLLPGTTYYYSIYTFDAIGPCYKTPTLTTGSFTTLSCSSPTIQASLLTVSCIQYDAMNLSFTRGNGDRVLVLAKAGSNVDADPVFSTSYTANSVFGSGSEIGTGNYVLYDGNDAGPVTVQVTGLSPGVTYYYKIYEYNSPPECYTATPSGISATTRAPGTYVSSTCTQNTANVSLGALSADVIKLTIVISGGEDFAATLNSISFTSTGTTNTATDVTNVRIFYTGTSNSFSNATQFGSTFTSFGANTAVDTFALKAGNNYFWIAYDVKASATVGNVLDATVTSINVTDNLSTADRTPTVTAPAGSRPITAPVALVYCSGVNPIAVGAAAGCEYSCSQGEYLVSITLTGSTILSFGGWPCDGTSPCIDSKSYTDLFGSNVYSLNQGGSYPMSINFSTWFSMDMWWVLWVDWDQDALFSNAAPERYPAAGSIDQWTSQNITVPASVSSGRHRARLWIQEFSYKPTTPCRTTRGPLTTSIGYIVDFNIFVPDGSLPDLDPPATGDTSCPTPITLVNSPVNYNLGDTPIPLSATGSDLLWFTSPTGGVGSTTAPTPSTSSSGTQTFYVSQNNGTCEGARTQIFVNVYTPPMPIAPLASVIQPNCLVPTGIIILSDLPNPGSWIINPNGISGTGSNDTIGPLPPGTYNYSVTDSLGCISQFSGNAVINPPPANPSTPVVGTVTQPSGVGADTTGSVELTGLPANGWIINPGGIVGAVGTTSVTISGLAPGTYTFTVTNADGCTSDTTIDIVISGPLPITLLTFSGKCENGIAVLQWTTASETNNDYFTIERYRDKDSWEFVAKIQGAGNSTTLIDYFYSDKKIESNGSYYRLKQTDFDGKYTYSDLIHVENCRSNTEIIVIPNPSKGVFSLQYHGDTRLFRSIDIYNVLGINIYHLDEYQSIIDISEHQSGVYFLNFNLESEKIIRQIIIQK